MLLDNVYINLYFRVINFIGVVHTDYLRRTLPGAAAMNYSMHLGPVCLY